VVWSEDGCWDVIAQDGTPLDGLLVEHLENDGACQGVVGNIYENPEIEIVK
jgi:hypothetical protein